MLATKKGIEINREELWALLSFTGEGEQYSAVHLRINGAGKLKAAATDGKRTVQCETTAEGSAPCECAVDAEFLELCKNACDIPEKSILIHLNAAGVKDAYVVDQAGKMIAPIGWNRAASTTQLSMDDVVTGLRVPSDSGHRGAWCAIDPTALRGLNRVRVATNKCPITIYPPSDPTAPLHFEARSDRGHWKGAIVPERVIAPGSEAEEPPQPQETAPGRPDRHRQLDLADRAANPVRADEPLPEDGGRASDDDPVITDEEAKRLRDEQTERDFVAGKGLNDKPKRGGKGKGGAKKGK